MPKYLAKFAKGRPVVIDIDGNPVPNAVVRRLNFPSGPVEAVDGRKWGPDHRPPTVDIEVNGGMIRDVPVQTVNARDKNPN